MRFKAASASLFLLLTASGCFLGGHGPDTEKDRLAAAKHSLKMRPASATLDTLILQIGANRPDPEREFMRAALRKYFRTDLLEQKIIDSMVKNFTADEIDALTKFYTSPEGKSVMAKFGAYSADLVPFVKEEENRAVNLYSDEMRH